MRELCKFYIAFVLALSVIYLMVFVASPGALILSIFLIGILFIQTFILGD